MGVGESLRRCRLEDDRVPRRRSVATRQPRGRSRVQGGLLKEAPVVQGEVAFPYLALNQAHLTPPATIRPQCNEINWSPAARRTNDEPSLAFKVPPYPALKIGPSASSAHVRTQSTPLLGQGRRADGTLHS